MVCLRSYWSAQILGTILLVAGGDASDCVRGLSHLWYEQLLFKSSSLWLPQRELQQGQQSSHQIFAKKYQFYSGICEIKTTIDLQNKARKTTQLPSPRMANLYRKTPFPNYQYLNLFVSADRNWTFFFFGGGGVISSATVPVWECSLL